MKNQTLNPLEQSDQLPIFSPPFVCSRSLIWLSSIVICASLSRLFPFHLDPTIDGLSPHYHPSSRALAPFLLKLSELIS